MKAGQRQQVRNELFQKCPIPPPSPASRLPHSAVPGRVTSQRTAPRFGDGFAGGVNCGLFAIPYRNCLPALLSPTEPSGNKLCPYLLTCHSYVPLPWNPFLPDLGKA